MAASTTIKIQVPEKLRSKETAISLQHWKNTFTVYIQRDAIFSPFFNVKVGPNKERLWLQEWRKRYSDSKNRKLQALHVPRGLVSPWTLLEPQDHGEIQVHGRYLGDIQLHLQRRDLRRVLPGPSSDWVQQHRVSSLLSSQNHLPYREQQVPAQEDVRWPWLRRKWWLHEHHHDGFGSNLLVREDWQMPYSSGQDRVCHPNKRGQEIVWALFIDSQGHPGHAREAMRLIYQMNIVFE